MIAEWTSTRKRGAFDVGVALRFGVRAKAASEVYALTVTPL
jgi:hypothetical protein